MSKSKFTAPQRRLLGKANEAWSSLKSLPESELTNEVHSIRETVFRKSGDSEAIAIRALGVAKEAVRRALGLEMYDVQLLAASALIPGRVAEMQTGEGKKISAAPAAIFGGILASGTHVATPNDYLAKRDFEELRPVYEVLGLRAGLLDFEQSPQEKKEAYQCDITYGPGYQFGFDYLTDHLGLKQVEDAPLGTRLIGQLYGQDAAEAAVCMRGQSYSVVDEIDNVLIDDACSPLVISESQQGEAPDADAVFLAKQVASLLEADKDYSSPAPFQIDLTERGKEIVHHEKIAIPVEQLTRPWATYVETALNAEVHYQRDVDYVVDDQNVKIVDSTTGRIFDDRSWQSGLHQAIEAKELVEVTPERLPLAQITRQRFYRLYELLGGMTGTGTNCVAELSSIYRLGVTVIPLRIPSKRIVMPMRTFSTSEQKWESIVQSLKNFHHRQRPVLIGTRTISESIMLANLIESHNIPFELLNGCQDAAEADVVARAGQPGAVTIATNLAGRGTDIKLPAEVKDLGGLHVIVSECAESARVDRQLVGRCARQGNPGSAQTFVSADDWLLETHGQWLSHSLKRMSGGELAFDIESQIRKIQTSVERTNYAKRLQLFKQSEQQNKIFEYS